MATLKIATPQMILDAVIKGENAAKAKAKANGTKEYQGIHVVYSGLNEWLKLKGFDARESTTRAVASGKVFGRGAKGGYILSSTPFKSVEMNNARLAVFEAPTPSRQVKSVADAANKAGKS